MFNDTQQRRVPHAFYNVCRNTRLGIRQAVLTDSFTIADMIYGVNPRGYEVVRVCRKKTNRFCQHSCTPIDITVRPSLAYARDMDRLTKKKS